MAHKMEAKKIKAIVFAVQDILKGKTSLEEQSLYERLKVVYKNGYRQGMRLVKKAAVAESKSGELPPYLK